MQCLCRRQRYEDSRPRLLEPSFIWGLRFSLVVDKADTMAVINEWGGLWPAAALRCVICSVADNLD